MNPRRPDRYPAELGHYGDFLCGMWASACDAFDVPAEQAAQTTGELRGLLPSWADDAIGDAPPFHSYVAGDGFPAELSVNWSGRQPELRALFDCLPDFREGYDTAPAGHSGTAELRAASSRFREINEVFTPAAGRPTPAPLWHAIAWRPPAPLIHKAYFGLFEWQVPERYAAVSEAMRRLGMADAWDHARQWIERDGQADSRNIEFVGLDLTETADARVKIYYVTTGTDIHELNRMASAASAHDPANALAAYRTLTAGRDDVGGPALTCLAFRSGLSRAAEATTHLRLSSLTSGDLETVQRTEALVAREHGNAQRLRALVAALAPGGLESSRGLVEVVSYRITPARHDVTTYLRFPVFTQQPTTVTTMASAADLG